MSLGRVTFNAYSLGQRFTGLPGFVHLRPTAPLFRTTVADDTRVLRLARSEALVAGEIDALVNATDDVTLSPLGWQWVASFDVPGIEQPDVTFSLATGQHVNLADLVSLTSPPAVVEVVSDESRRAAEAAADRAAEIVAAFDPGAEVTDLPDLSLYFENGMA